MFTWLNTQGVRSSDGFEVQFTGRFTVEYREGGRYLTVDVEGGANRMIQFDRKSFARWTNSRQINSPDEQERMVKNFLAALDFQGLRGAWPACLTV